AHSIPSDHEIYRQHFQEKYNTLYFTCVKVCSPRVSAGVTSSCWMLSFPQFKCKKEASVDVNTLPNVVETTFTPQSTNTGEFQTYGLSFARGSVSCYTISSNAYCPWNIQVGGDVIIYSNVIVYLERDEGFLNGGWERYSTFNFRYPVNIATSTIRNEASFKLPKGSYRVKLGGNFTTAKNGIYSAVANGSSYFKIN
ncbi:hypothetical protein ACFPYN_17400, partial [Paenisporosarcina macmurdoensis]